MKEIIRKDTICAISTPLGKSGIGIVRLSGKKSIKIAGKVFLAKNKKKPSRFRSHTIHYGHIVDPSEKYKIVDEILLTVMKSPNTYTKEDIAEINCHGGIASLKKILDIVLKEGARLADPGEFTMRGFLNGRIDLAQAEAVNDVINAKTEASLKAAVSQLEGGLSTPIKNLRNSMFDILTDMEAQLDFSEEEISYCDHVSFLKRLQKQDDQLKKIIKTEDLGALLRDGLSCVICGKPNAGKSSLLNAMLRRKRAIVTHLPGTTRDTIEENIQINGIPVRIIDTAGITSTKNIIEKEGVKRSRYQIKNADLVIFVLDASKKYSRKDEEILKIIKTKKKVVVVNKIDLKTKLDLKKAQKKTKGKIIPLSVRKNKNLNLLLKEIQHIISIGNDCHPEASFLTSRRHKNNLEKTQKSLKHAIKQLKKGTSYEAISVDLSECVKYLGYIIGCSVEPDMLKSIFSKFCIGK